MYSLTSITIIESSNDGLSPENPNPQGFCCSMFPVHVGFHTSIYNIAKKNA